jgi:hypothetical protein
MTTPEKSPPKARKRRKKPPEEVHLFYCFTAWFHQPQIEARYRVLMEAMKERELKERLRKLLPEPPPLAVPQGLHGLDGIPVQEVTFTNPSVTDATDHRSTRLEFLADANHYGA